MANATHTPLDVLKAARELLSDPAKWTKGIAGFFGDAECLCVRGATFAATGTLPGWAPPLALTQAEIALLDTVREVYPKFRLVKRRGVGMLAEWNDRAKRTHAEVLDLFDRTIARLEAGQTPTPQGGGTL